MEVNLIISDGNQTNAWHINPTECQFLIGIDGSVTIKPADSAWEQVLYADVDTYQQIDPTKDPWPKILAMAAEMRRAGDEARKAAAEKISRP